MREGDTAAARNAGKGRQTGLSQCPSSVYQSSWAHGEKASERYIGPFIGCGGDMHIAGSLVFTFNFGSARKYIINGKTIVIDAETESKI